MPIESPILDDLDFKTVDALLRNQIPVYAPEWTDHNDSDPGITMIQLFSYLAEQIGYRLNQVPEKNYIEFLKLVGIRLRPAESASTWMNFVLTKPETVEQFLIPVGSRIKAKSDAEVPPVFETDINLDAVPAQLATLITTESSDLRQINLSGETGPGEGGDEDAYIAQRFSIAWDGKTPKLKDMPVQTVPLFQRPSEATHSHLWIGLAFNPAVTAGFLGARVTLTLQLDDDEQPAADAIAQCGEQALELVNSADPESELVTYTYYRPPRADEPEGSWQPLALIGDGTQGWTRSGQIRFDVPLRMGPVPDSEWEKVEDIAATTESAGSVILHPLIGALKSPVTGTPDFVPVSGWLHVAFDPAVTVVPRLMLRALSFNVAPATNAETVRNEQLGRGTSQQGQRLSLAHGNVLPATLELVTIGPAPLQETRQWARVDSFDAVDPFARVYVLDPEAGEIAFGDATRGRPPEETERIVAERYRHGGGEDAEVDVAAVNKPDSLPVAVEAAVNIVAARGGKDAETLSEAKYRAPKQLKAQERAVTAGDFEFHTLQTVGVRVNRAIVVPLYKPYPEGSPDAPGLDLDKKAPGVVSVIVVPDEEGLYPTPTEGMLRIVCDHLDNYRLITTEVYTATPQYVRLYDIMVEVKAEPGFTRTQLREAIGGHLATYFHVITGGESGSGFPFGSVVHHADLVAQVFHVQGVDRVESLEAWYDGHTPDEAVPAMSWRLERDQARRLSNCIENESDDEKIVLAADEVVFVDTSSLNIRIVED